MGQGNSWGALGGLTFVQTCSNADVEQALQKAEKAGAGARWRDPRGPMTLAEAADFLHVSIRQLHRLRKAGVIHDCRRFGKEGTVQRSDVLRLASANGRSS